MRDTDIKTSFKFFRYFKIFMIVSRLLHQESIMTTIVVKKERITEKPEPLIRQLKHYYKIL